MQSLKDQLSKLVPVTKKLHVFRTRKDLDDAKANAPCYIKHAVVLGESTYGNTYDEIEIHFPVTQGLVLDWLNVAVFTRLLPHKS